MRTPQDALELFRGVRRRLAEEAGLDPSAELVRLESAILRADPALDLRPAEATAVLRQLPGDIHGFTGRSGSGELDALVARGKDAALAPILVSGIPGIGKTALAVHWAHRVSDRFPHGQLYVDLRGYGRQRPVRPIGALTAFLRALGVPGEQIPLDESEAASMYRSWLSGKQVLIVADNAGSAEQVRPLLPGADHCLIVVTSRERLTGLVARDGARRVTLDVLSLDEAVALLADTVGAVRVSAEPRAAVDLAEACGRLPLALRIAAANLDDRPGGGVAAHVAAMHHSGRIASLTVRGDETTCVAAAFDCSFQALAPDARRTFRLLGLLPGPESRRKLWRR